MHSGNGHGDRHRMLGNRLVFSGSICNEVYLTGDDEVYIRPGGSAYRGAAALLTLQAEATVIATTATSLNRDTLEKFKRSEVRILDQTVDKGRETALVFDLRGGEGRARPLASFGTPSRPPVEYLENIPFRNLLVHVSAQDPAQMEEVIGVARQLQPSASFSCNLEESQLVGKNLEALLSVVGKCRVVFMNRRELQWLRKRRQLAEVMRDRLAVVTCGDAGAICFADGVAFFAHTPAPRRAVCGAGAGDVFAGAFLASLLSSRDPSRAAVFACEVAAASVADFGFEEVLRERHSVHRISPRSLLGEPRVTLSDPWEIHDVSPYREVVEATGTFVVRDGCLLLVRKPDEKAFVPGVFYVPGGKLEADETPEQCARRELDEETGLGGGSFHELSVFYYPDPKDPGKLYRFYQFLVTETEGEAKPRDDVIECHWRALEELGRAELFDLTRAQLFLTDLLGPVSLRAGDSL